MKQKFRIVLVSMLLVVGMLVAAGASSYDHCADQLKALGLFQGTEQGYELDLGQGRLHHEIYLSDARRCSPEKLKTVIRVPVKNTGTLVFPQE